MATAFAFTPQGGEVKSSAFSAMFKAVAIILITAILAWAWRLYAAGHVEPTLRSSGWLAAAIGMMLYTEWYILTGVTTLDSTALRQTWVWQKRVNLHELAYVKLIRVPGFDWLIAPRLYTKTFSNKLTVFYASSSAMLQAFQQLESALNAQRHAP
jgi:hypothetical protein